MYNMPIKLSTAMCYFTENDTIEVVNVVMNNMQNYLPTDINEQEEEM